MKSGYIKSLDGARGLAIILMMSFHANLNHFGWMGVQLFFVLSGFLITRILWKEKDQLTTNGFKLRKFWTRRSLRIFPLYFGFLFVISLLYIFARFPVYYPTYIPYLFTYTFNYTRTIHGWGGNPLFTHFWSLSIEEQFYLFFPLVIFFTPKKIVRFFMVSVIVLAPLVRFCLFKYFSRYGTVTAADAVYWHTLSHLDALFIGGIIPIFSLDKKIRKPGNLLGLTVLIAIAAGLINYVSLKDGAYSWTFGYGHGQSRHFEYVWHYTLLNFMFGSLVLTLVSKTSNQYLTGKIFEMEWLVRIGRVSYGMYIFHWAILVYIFNRYIPASNPAMKTLLFLPYLFTVYLFAEFSFRFYESWFLRLKSKIFGEKKRILLDDVARGK